MEMHLKFSKLNYQQREKPATTTKMIRETKSKSHTQYVNQSDILWNSLIYGWLLDTCSHAQPDSFSIFFRCLIRLVPRKRRGGRAREREIKTRKVNQTTESMITWTRFKLFWFARCCTSYCCCHRHRCRLSLFCSRLSITAGVFFFALDHSSISFLLIVSSLCPSLSRALFLVLVCSCVSVVMLLFSVNYFFRFFFFP